MAEERLLAHCEKMQAELEQWGELRNTPRGWQRLDEDWEIRHVLISPVSPFPHLREHSEILKRHQVRCEVTQMMKKYTTCQIKGEWDDINNFNIFFWGYPDTLFIKVPGSNSDVFRPHRSRWFNHARIVQYVSPWSSLCDIDLCWINAPWNQRCPTVYSEKKSNDHKMTSFGRARTLGGQTTTGDVSFCYFKLLSCEWWIAGEC